MGWGPKAPDPNPGMIASAQASERVAQEQLALAREQFAYTREQDAQNWARISPLIEQQQRISDAQEARSADYYNYERTTFRPVEQRAVQQAMDFNTETAREEMAGAAASDVTQQMGVAREAGGRSLARYGINPNSAKFAAINNDLTLSEGLARAGAQNNARMQAKQIGQGMLIDAAGLGRNLAPNATAAAQTASAANTAATNSQLNTSAAGINGRNSAIGNFNGVQNGLQTAGGLYAADFNGRMSAYNSSMQALGGLASGIGSAAGVYFGMPPRK